MNLRLIQSLEVEYEQTIREILEGYIADGHGLRFTAGILGFKTPGQLKAIADEMGLIFPTVTHRGQIPGEELSPDHKRNISTGRRSGNIKRINFNGQTVTYVELAEQFDLSRQVVQYRASKGDQGRDLVRPAGTPKTGMYHDRRN